MKGLKGAIFTMGILLGTCELAFAEAGGSLGLPITSSQAEIKVSDALEQDLDNLAIPSDDENLKNELHRIVAEQSMAKVISVIGSSAKTE